MYAPSPAYRPLVSPADCAMLLAPGVQVRAPSGRDAMPLQLGSRQIAHIAVIGSGQIGPDIALHFAKTIAGLGGRVTVVDVSDKALQAGQARTWKKIDRGAESGAWKPADAQAMKAALTFTSDYQATAGAELVVEAATEDEGLKCRIFKQLQEFVAADAILLSNSSHLEPERIFATVADQSRTAVAHYFFPAERNPMVEIIPGAATSPQTTAWLMGFFEQIGKIPVRVASRYGYAADPVFEGIFAAACLCVEEGLGTVKEVDWAARAAVGLNVGPFTAMNLTGGSPITAHGLDLMHQRFAGPSWPDPWFKAPKLLTDLLATAGLGGQWTVCGRGETLTLPDDQNLKIIEALRGAYLGICFSILDSGIIDTGDFELLIETALDMKGPLRLIGELGPQEALRLCEAYHAAHPNLPVSEQVRAMAKENRAQVPSNLSQEVVSTPSGNVLVVRIRRPKVLNALDHTTYGQLMAVATRLKQDKDLIGLVIGGFGTKAFVSGADIHALAQVHTPDQGYAIAKVAHDLATALESSEKPVVAALTGLAFGGGLELAMACHARIAADKLKVLAGLPEVNLGIIPAGGGTQRLPRWVGLERANSLLRTGSSLSSVDALAAGLVHKLVTQSEVVAAAVDHVVALHTGAEPWRRIDQGPLAADGVQLAPVDIGHRSRKVDELLVQSLTFGAIHGLEQGLVEELEVFRRICQLDDMRVGVDHFVKNGPKTPAPFVHA